MDWTTRFSTVAAALDKPGEAIIDGEVVVVHEGGTNFSEPGRASSRQSRRPSQTSADRAQAGATGPVKRYAAPNAILATPDRGWPTDVFEHAAKLNWEGIISKRADAPYR